MRLSISYILIACIFFLVYSCTNQNAKKEKPRLIVKHVFTTGLPNPYDGSRADYRDDYYYVYNYTDTDYPLFEKILDTISFDTSYRFHSHLFLQYDEDLPDTIHMKNEMEGRQYVSESEIYPGSEKYKQYAILSLAFVRGFLSEADQVRKEKLIPNSYRISTFNDNKSDERYFLKDSVSRKLVEVDRSVVSIPDSGIRKID